MSSKKQLLAECQRKLSTVEVMVEEFVRAEEPVLLSSYKLLSNILSIIRNEEIEGVEEIMVRDKPLCIISCDASIKENPGGPASVGVVINYMDREPIKINRVVKSQTSNQAEYDAVYFALVSFMNLINTPSCSIEVRSDSQLVIEQLLGNRQCKDKRLQEKRDSILELVRNLPVAVNFVWMPRCSTPELKEANYLAQDILGVPRH